MASASASKKRGGNSCAHSIVENELCSKYRAYRNATRGTMASPTTTGLPPDLEAMMLARAMQRRAKRPRTDRLFVLERDHAANRAETQRTTIPAIPRPTQPLTGNLIAELERKQRQWAGMDSESEWHFAHPKLEQKEAAHRCKHPQKYSKHRDEDIMRRQLKAGEASPVDWRICSLAPTSERHSREAKAGVRGDGRRLAEKGDSKAVVKAKWWAERKRIVSGLPLVVEADKDQLAAKKRKEERAAKWERKAHACC